MSNKQPSGQDGFGASQTNNRKLAEIWLDKLQETQRSAARVECQRCGTSMSRAHARSLRKDADGGLRACPHCPDMVFDRLSGGYRAMKRPERHKLEGSA